MADLRWLINNQNLTINDGRIASPKDAVKLDLQIHASLKYHVHSTFGLVCS